MKKIFLSILTLIASLNVFCQSDNIDKYIKSKMQEKSIPGLQLAIVKNNKIIKTGAYGIANIEDSIRVDSETTFAINSMTKAFTGVAVMQLVEEGKIALEDPISNYIDSLPDNWKSITIKQMLTHTSGLPNMMDYNAKIIASWEEVQKLPMVFEPNSNFQYNQTNYVIIGKIINKISGSTFQEFIKERQLKLISADRTMESGFGHYQSVIPHSARGYTYFINGSLTHAYEEFPEEFRTAAGMSSTAIELANWHLALQNGTFLKKPKNLSTLWTPAILNNGETKGFGGTLNGYAIGTPIMIKPNKSKIIASIGGGRSAALTFLDKEVTIIVLTNLKGAFPERFIEEILEFLD
ncbi:serine hydrolase domain-containing protein [Lutibacter aestuarii]|uniref:Serine hydrolase domain-containing protein n=1 Tax=Lutibacter aestuarii TaxID=861111 RepID=A0ABW2Z7W0_9FLAO|nr:serine hydrolase domain-containing protein [uncultured Lutibacter sp.]